MSLRALCAAALLSCASFTAWAGPVTGLYYTSSAESWVGGGETRTIIDNEWTTFYAGGSYDGGVSFWIDDATPDNPYGWSSLWWFLDFAPAAGETLAVGHYANAMRFPFQEPGFAGLSFGGNGRGNNTLTGFFDILEITFADDGSLAAFAADFTQYDEGFESWWNHGAIRYNSSVALPGAPTSVPQPAALALLAVAGLMLRRARRT